MSQLISSQDHNSFAPRQQPVIHMFSTTDNIRKNDNRDSEINKEIVMKSILCGLKLSKAIKLLETHEFHKYAKKALNLKQRKWPETRW